MAGDGLGFLLNRDCSSVRAFSARQEVQAEIAGVGAKTKTEVEAETEAIASRAADQQRQNTSGDRLG